MPELMNLFPIAEVVGSNMAKDYSGWSGLRKVMQWIRNTTSKQLGNAMTDELL